MENCFESFVSEQAHEFYDIYQPTCIDTDILQDFIIWLIDNHPLTSKDSIANLIEDLKYKKEIL